MFGGIGTFDDLYCINDVNKEMSVKGSSCRTVGARSIQSHAALQMLKQRGRRQK